MTMTWEEIHQSKYVKLKTWLKLLYIEFSTQSRTLLVYILWFLLSTCVWDMEYDMNMVLREYKLN